MSLASGLQGFPLGAAGEIALTVEGEVVARERAIRSAALVPDRDVGLDLLLDAPGEKLAGAVSRIGGDEVWEGRALPLIRELERPDVPTEALRTRRPVEVGGGRVQIGP